MIGLCWWCDHPTNVCPCRANTVTEFEVQRRHREAVQRAKASGWAGHARRRPSNDPTGTRRWAA